MRVLLLMILAVFSLSVSAQTITLNGNVKDATGDPIIGASIVEKGNTSNGTITNLNGDFSLKVPANATLIVSYIGMKTQEIAIKGKNKIDVTLSDDTKALDEVVVIGYGTAKRKDITGSVATVSSEVLSAVPVASATEALQGKMAGVQITTTEGSPDAEMKIRVRGGGSITGDNTPLFIVDGFPVESISDIPASDIEDMTVLKDASSTAIYGSRGANGVMLVTTKKGQENTKATINVSLEASYFRPINVPKFADGATYMRAYNEAEQARSLTPITSPKYSEDQILNTELGTNPYVYPDVDWFDQIFRSGNYNQRANVNVSGGGSRVTYYMSLQANHDTGLLDAPDYFYNPNINQWQYNFQNNISYKLTNTTTIDLRMMAQIGNLQGPNYNIGNDLYKRVMRANPVEFPAYFPQQEGDDGFIRFGGGEIKPGVLGTNPYEYMMSSFKEVNFNTLNTSLALNQDLSVITKGLSLKALVNFKNWSETSYTRNIKSNIYRVKDGSYNPETGEYDYQLLQTGDQFLSQSGIGRNSDQTFYFDARLDWKRSFGDHNLTAMAMYMMREYRSDVLPNRNQGYSGRVTYDYASKYLVEFNFGYNGSERLAAGQRFEFFPAVSAGWVASSEKFWEPISKYINHFKIRGSYGLVGSDAFASGAPHFLYQNNIGIGSAHKFWTGLPTSEISKQGPGFYVLAVQDAGWEHVKKFDIGFDMMLFNQLNITFDYFHDKRERILMSRASWPSMLGYWGSKPWSNIGEVENQGFELSLNWTKQFGKDLTLPTTRMNINMWMNPVIRMFGKPIPANH